MESKFINADEVAEIFEVTKPIAYKKIAELNKELKNQGFRTLQGKVSRKYFNERYGLTLDCKLTE